MANLMTNYSWVMHILLAIFVTLLAVYIENIVYHHVKMQLKKTRFFWDDAFVDALHKPLRVLFIFLGIMYIASIFQEIVEEFFVWEILTFINLAGIALIAAWFFVRFISIVEGYFLDGRHFAHSVDKTTVQAVSKLLRITILVLVVIMLVQELGIPLSGVLAFGGAGALIVGFAAKEMLSNFFGGLLIYLDRPMKVGDWIRSPEKEIEGTVEYIGWRLTRILTLDRRPLYVPNATFLTVAIENPSRMKHRRILTTLALRYQDAVKLPTIVKEIEMMLRNHPDIDSSVNLLVHFTHFGASSLDLIVDAFTTVLDIGPFRTVQQDVYFKIIDIIKKNNADFACTNQAMYVADASQIKIKGITNNENT